MYWDKISYNKYMLTQAERLEVESEDLFIYKQLNKNEENFSEEKLSDEENIDYFSLG